MHVLSAPLLFIVEKNPKISLSPPELCQFALSVCLLIEDGGSFISSVSHRGTYLFSVTRDDIEGIDYLHCTWRWLELLFPHDVLWRVHGVIH